MKIISDYIANKNEKVSLEVPHPFIKGKKCTIHYETLEGARVVIIAGKDRYRVISEYNPEVTDDLLRKMEKGKQPPIDQKYNLW